MNTEPEQSEGTMTAKEKVLARYPRSYVKTSDLIPPFFVCLPSGKPISFREETEEAAWQDAAESLPDSSSTSDELTLTRLRAAQLQERLDAVELKYAELVSLHASIIDQGRKVLNATSEIGMSHAEYIEWAMERLEGR